MARMPSASASVASSIRVPGSIAQPRLLSRLEPLSRVEPDRLPETLRAREVLVLSAEEEPREDLHRLPTLVKLPEPGQEDLLAQALAAREELGHERRRRLPVELL